MKKMFISLGTGVCAGIIDTVPMLIQKIDAYATISAFVHWVVLGFIISYIKLQISAWLKGIIVAVVSALPIVVLVFEDDPQSVIPILGMSVILGAVVGIMTKKFASN